MECPTGRGGMRDLMKSHTGFNPSQIIDPENIRNLYVGHNDLNEIDFFNFKNLESLDISHNNITDISNLPKSLKWICIADNPIENYEPLYGLINLEYLWAHQSNIDIRECNLMSKLIQLLIDDCQDIFDIEVVKNFPNLSILEMVNNKVEDISCLKNKKLTHLNIMNNNVSDIGCLFGMATLKKLNIRGNPIKSYDPIKTLNLRRLCL
jgi:Leucine-rich repeat (LRR) protein